MTGRVADVVADVAVVGGGIVGLAIAAALAERELAVAVVAARRPGAASAAAAGLLVPHYSREGISEPVQRFMTSGRDLYPSYVGWVEETSGVRVPLDLSGAIELARSPADCAELRRTSPPGAEPLTPSAVASLEPALAPTSGGVVYPRDGAVDNVRLTEALASIVRRQRRARVIDDAAVRLDVDAATPIVVGASGVRVQAHRLVLAAGAWSAAIDGLPRPIPVRPIRGQICALRTAPLRHVVLAPDVYMVGRGGDRTLVGSTMEDVGYDPSTTPEAIETLRRRAVAVCPALAIQPVVASWGGLRPGTPDLLPVLGADPEYPGLIYACGHSRNGILLAPITAAVTSAMVTGEQPRWDLSPFGIERFARLEEVSNRRPRC